MRNEFSAFAGVICLLLAPRIDAHHSFAAVFDINQPIEITGTVIELEWTNPHAWIHIETDGDGPDTWSIELLGINTLLKQGWTPGTLERGDVIHVTGYGARDNSNEVNASTVTMVETGEQLWVSAPRDD